MRCEVLVGGELPALVVGRWGVDVRVGL